MLDQVEWRNRKPDDELKSMAGEAAAQGTNLVGPVERYDLLRCPGNLIRLTG